MAQPWTLYIDAIARTVWRVKVEMRRRGVFAGGAAPGGLRVRSSAVAVVVVVVVSAASRVTGKE